MTGQCPTAGQPAASKQDLFHIAATLANRDEYGTLILDRVGRILSCGEPAEKIFGAGVAELKGRHISDLIADFRRSDSSRSYGARYLSYLCGCGEWRKFAAMDVDGHEFAVELNLARMVSDGQDIFALNVHRPGE